MSVYLDQSQWDEYKGVINDFLDDVGNDKIIWQRSTTGVIPRHGEDRKLNLEPFELRGLFQYNAYRTWPINQLTDTGVEDKQSELLLLSIKYLKSLNLLDENNKLIYNPSQDKFTHRGFDYEATGDSFVSQAEDEPLIFMIILKRYDAQKIQKN